MFSHTFIKLFQWINIEVSEKSWYFLIFRSLTAIDLFIIELYKKVCLQKRSKYFKNILSMGSMLCGSTKYWQTCNCVHPKLAKLKAAVALFSLSQKLPKIIIILMILNIIIKLNRSITLFLLKCSWYYIDSYIFSFFIFFICLVFIFHWDFLQQLIVDWICKWLDHVL